MKPIDYINQEFSERITKPILDYLSSKYPQERFFSEYERGNREVVFTGIFRKRTFRFSQRIAELTTYFSPLVSNQGVPDVSRCNTPFLSKRELEKILQTEELKNR